MAYAAKPSPFAPAGLPDMPTVGGVRLATAAAGIRYEGRTDLLVATLAPGTVVGGVLTRSKTCSAPVVKCRESLASGGRARILVVNSGNANAFTGMKGRAAVDVTVAHAAKSVGGSDDEVYVASTGVIGEPMDAGKFAPLLKGLADNAKPDAFHDAARAIMTTDTYPKLATRTADVGGTPITINGIAKGAGMIAPDMATMLCFVFTDAAITQPLLQDLVAQHADRTFNCITVDGDTSTSDTVLVFATGEARTHGAVQIADAAGPAYQAFAGALHDVLLDLALQVVKDGEGLSKFVTIEVAGAENDRSARNIGMAMANSPILKTAIAGEDPNWGRVVMAVGKAGEAADRDRLAIWFGPHLVAADGERAPDYDESTVAEYMKQPEIVIRVDVGIADGSATVWTCDLTHDYVSINADYRS